MDDLSLAARMYMVSGKIPGLTRGFSIYETPSGEKVNSRVLAAYLIAATVEYLKSTGSLDYRLDEIPAIGGRLPVLILNRLAWNGAGFERKMLEKLDVPKNLIELVKDLIGGRYQVPEEHILWLIRSEYPREEFMRQEQVKVLMMSRMEARWIPEKVMPLVNAWYNDLLPWWNHTLGLPWLQTAVRNCNFAFTATKAQPRRDND
jgi:hypothetical protein